MKQAVILGTREQFMEYYRPFCFGISRKMIYGYESKSELVALGAGHCSGEWNYADVEDLTSAATERLAKCPEKYWNEPIYVKRMIVHGIINAFQKRKKVMQHEVPPPAPPIQAIVHRGKNISPGDPQNVNWFDKQEGRDGTGIYVQSKFDSGKIQSALKHLPQAERIVIDLRFGITNPRALTERAIAQKLGRTPFWVERRLAVGIKHIRKEIGVEVSR